MHIILMIILILSQLLAILLFILNFIFISFMYFMIILIKTFYLSYLIIITHIFQLILFIIINLYVVLIFHHLFIILHCFIRFNNLQILSPLQQQFKINYKLNSHLCNLINYIIKIKIVNCQFLNQIDIYHYFYYFKPIYILFHTVFIQLDHNFYLIIILLNLSVPLYLLFVIF